MATTFRRLVFSFTCTNLYLRCIRFTSLLEYLPGYRVSLIDPLAYNCLPKPEMTATHKIPAWTTIIIVDLIAHCLKSLVTRTLPYNPRNFPFHAVSHSSYLRMSEARVIAFYKLHIIKEQRITLLFRGSTVCLFMVLHLCWYSGLQ